MSESFIINEPRSNYKEMWQVTMSVTQILYAMRIESDFDFVPRLDR
jgi:hypothetical protein